jgi:hypothetical protein
MSELLTFIAGAVIGALSSWLITRYYAVKASDEQRTELNRLRDELKPRNTLEEFERRLETATWTKQFIDHVETWVCDADNTFQVIHGERTRDFTERWTTVYPDRSAAAYPIFLKIGGVVVKELTFISMDGGRIFVPMAEIRPAGEGSVDYFWNLNSIEVKVCRVIGSYYIYETLERVAKHSKIELVA